MKTLIIKFIKEAVVEIVTAIIEAKSKGLNKKIVELETRLNSLQNFVESKLGAMPEEVE